MNKKVQFAGLTIIIPDGWFDVTEDLPAGSPSTLAKTDGIGALQFSTAKYHSGSRPNIQIQDLRDLLEEFGDSHGLGDPATIKEGAGKNPFVTADFPIEGQFLRIWHVTNGCDLVLVSYVTQEPQSQQLETELHEAATIIDSLDF